MIDLIIPTMWFVNDFEQSLQTYVSHNSIKKVIIIDNNQSKRPSYEILNHSKIEIVSYRRNIFVNPAWNEGYYRSKSKILGILNDDIQVSPEIFDMIMDFDVQEGDLIGVHLQGRQNNYKIDDFIDTKEEIVKLNYNPKKPIGSQAWAFGICMFMRRESYKPIPSLYQVWYGDEFFAQHSKNIYVINSNKIKGTISETLTKFNDPNSDISKRIELDSKNLIAYDHFINGKHWDIPHNMIELYKQQRKQSNKMEHIYKQPQFGNENWFSFDFLYKEVVKKFPSGSHFVEIGSWKGRSSSFMVVEIINSKKQILFDCVDTWGGSEEHTNMPELKNLYEIFKSNMKPLDGYYRDLKMTSMEAVKLYADETLDFVFLDGSHKYEDVKNDIIYWMPKLKPGGILAGDDYNGSWPGVIRAVNEVLGTENIKLEGITWIYQK